MGTDVVGDGLYSVGASHDVFAHGWNLLDVLCEIKENISKLFFFSLVLSI